MTELATIHFDLSPPTDDDRRRLEADLSDEERQVLLEHGTEAPFCGIFLEEKRGGAYTCRLCGLRLVEGGGKVGRGGGWASGGRGWAAGGLECVGGGSGGMVR